MDLDLLVGQMIMIGFDGYELNSDHMDILRRIKPCGIVLFRKNMRGARQVRRLLSDFYNFSINIGLPPLLIALDHEGGSVFRMAGHLTPLPSAMALGATNDPSCVECIAGIAGEELKSLGFNMNFAPVADLNTNPMNPVIGIRSFGDDPVRVASMVSRYVSTLQSFGVMAVAKHFPGHGDTSIDSHLDLPSVDVDMNTLLNRELIPFKAAVDSGVSCIMTSHVSFPNIDPSELPATFSSILLQDILRGMLGFNGVIISDALEMKAISGRFDVRDVASYGLKAGLDIFLRCFDFDYIFDLKDSIIKLVNNGLISRDRIYESFKRIENLRGRFNLPSIMDSIYKVPLENLRKNRYLSHKTSLAAVTVNNGDLLKPLGIFGSLAILIPKNLERFLSNFHPEVVSLFVHEFGADIGTMVITVYDENISIDDILDVVLNVDGVLFFTYNAIFNKYQLDLYEKIKDKVSVIVIAGLPYDANFIFDKKPIIFTYGLNTISLSALVDVLCGSHIAGGVLPVKLNDSSICDTSPSHMHSL